ncbi:MAG: hypothetical protein HC906_14500, partial [Bacteroidales bacterium]|nr:hypothetical protein [Bacteroidales bacterium]
IARYLTMNVFHSGTHSSFERLLYKNVDLILVARTSSPDEQHLADSLGVELIETPVAIDALVFVANYKIPFNR